jgi:hypothetical protein
MTDFPRSLLEVQRRFPDDAACAAYLAAARWSEGFVCPECGGPRACLLVTKKHTYQCSLPFKHRRCVPDSLTKPQLLRIRPQ